MVANLSSRRSVLDPAGVPVSMTSHGDRLRTVHLAIESIARGSLRPSRLVLWVCDAQVLATLPIGLRRLQRRGLEIRLSEEFGPHTKYFPALSWPELATRPLVTADDDVIYPCHWLRDLVSAHERAPAHVHAHRAHVVSVGDGGLKAYETWQPCLTDAPSCRHFATGVSGVIYPPAMLSKIREAGDRFLELSPKADDVWLHCIALRHGFEVCQLQRLPQHFPFIPGTRSAALMVRNVRGGGNDVQIRRTYGEADLARLRCSPVVAPQADGEGWFTAPAWFTLLRDHGMSGALHPVTLTLRDAAGRELGALPLMRQGRVGWRSLSNYYSPVFAPAWVDADASARVNWSVTARDMAESAQAAVLQLQPLAEGAWWWRELRRALRKMGYAVYTYQCFGNWYLPVDVQAGFSAYWASRPSKLRHTVERARKRLSREHTWCVDIVQSEGDALDEGVQAYERVYAASWKPEEPHPEFMPALMRMAARQHQLRLGLLRVDGQVVAAQVWVVDQGVASIFKLAYLPGHERLSPGSVLTAALMAHVMDIDQVRQVDYLMGDDPYKQDWMSHRRERVGLLAFRLSHPGVWWGWSRHVAGLAWRRLAVPSGRG